MIGVLVNTLAVLVGATLGLLLYKGIPQKISAAVMTGIGACTVYIGITGLIKGENALVTILSMVCGAIVGTLIDLDRLINRFGDFLEQKTGKSENSNVARGFVTGSLLFCVGSMTIVGSLNAGLSGDNQLLYTKSVLDFFSSLVLATSLGFGVLFSSTFVLIFQGALVLLAGVLAPVLSTSAINEITCTGSVLILLLGLNLLGLGKFKVANYLPAIFFVPLFSYLFGLLI